MVGRLELKRDYDVKKKRMVERMENSFFWDRFGRNKFELIDGTRFNDRNSGKLYHQVHRKIGRAHHLLEGTENIY